MAPEPVFNFGEVFKAGQPTGLGKYSLLETWTYMMTQITETPYKHQKHLGSMSTRDLGGNFVTQRIRDFSHTTQELLAFFLETKGFVTME